MPGKKKESLTRFNRENIIQSARALFESRGIEKTTVDDIAKEADCSKSTLYVYFKSKEEILQTILLEQMEQLLSLLKENIEKEEEIPGQLSCGLQSDGRLREKVSDLLFLHVRKDRTARRAGKTGCAGCPVADL